MLLNQTDGDPSKGQMTSHLKPGVNMLTMMVAQSWLMFLVMLLRSTLKT